LPKTDTGYRNDAMVKQTTTWRRLLA